MSIESQQLKNILEAALLAAGEPRTIDELRSLFGDDHPPEKNALRAVLKELQDEYASRGIELREVASGFRIQVRESMSQWLSRLWEERPPRYSRALMETLAIIAYRQPVTRGDVEEIRGVVVTSNIIRTLLERNWIKVVGHRDVPGKPAMFGTTREFLDYFGLQKLDDLPPLAELARLEPVSVQLDLGTVDEGNPLDGAPASDAAQETYDAGAVANPFASENAGATSGLLEVSAALAARDDDDDDDFDDEDEDDDDFDDEDEDDDDFDDEDEDDDDFDDEDEDDDDFDDEDEDDDSDDRAEDELKDQEYNADRRENVPPGAATPLVGLRPPNAPALQTATVASLDEARAAAGVRKSEECLGADDAGPADVVPLKSS